MGPDEPQRPESEGRRRPSDDDEAFGFDDPAFDNGPGYSPDAAYSDGPSYSPGAGFSSGADYAGSRRAEYSDEYPEEYETPQFTAEEQEELAGLGNAVGPRRVLPLEDEPTNLVARYLFPTERYRGEWKRHWIHLSTPLSIGAGATLLLGYLAGFLTRQNINGLVTAAVLVWLAVIAWVAWEVFDWYYDRFILT